MILYEHQSNTRIIIYWSSQEGGVNDACYEKLWLGQPLWNHKNTKMKHKHVSVSAEILSVFSFLYPIMLRSWGSNMLQRGDYAREICYTLWLLTLPLSPCNLYVLFTSHFRLIYSGLSWRHRIFHLPHSQCCVQRMCQTFFFFFSSVQQTTSGIGHRVK